MYTEKRRDREKDLLSNDSFPKGPQWPVLRQSEARSQELFWVSKVGAGSQGFGSSSTAFPGHRQGAGWEAGLSVLEPVIIWDPSMFKKSTLAARPLRRAQYSFFFFKNCFYCKVRYIERSRDRKEDISLDNSLPK